MKAKEATLTLEQAKMLLRAHITIFELAGTALDPTARKMFEAVAVVLLALDEAEKAVTG